MEEIRHTLFLADIYPDKAQYLPLQEIRILVEASNPELSQREATVTIKVMLLNELVLEDKISLIIPANDKKTACFSFTAPGSDVQGFGVDAVLSVNGEELHTLSTAFDVALSWKKAPRYGFLSDFYREDEDDSSDIEQMVKYHLNVVQFYDWMYRHDDLIPEDVYFTDPLGRKLSLKAVKDKIGLCHRYGMKAMAYGAVYGASREFYEEHKEWALYDNSGNVQSLGNWLMIMNISPESPWTVHILNEYQRALKELDFDGIHMDTYGFPKTAFSRLGGEAKLENLEEHLRALINKTRGEIENIKQDAGVIFNSVNNWPVNTVAQAEQDAVYIEVWDPNERYQSLYQIISRAREIGKKPVILAAYLKPYSLKDGEDIEHADNCFLLISAVIFASGGYHILLGECNGVLTEEYFVNYAKLSGSFTRTVRNYYDFIVRYGSLLYDIDLKDLSMTHANGRNGEFVFENGTFSSYIQPGKVWTLIKEKPGFKVINLVNLTGIESDIWNEGKKNRPIPVENICIKALVDETVIGIFTASPDIDGGKVSTLEFQYEECVRGRCISFSIPKLYVWSVICIKVQ